MASSSKPMWQCASTKPGATRQPWASITWASAGAFTSLPTATILPPSISTWPFSISGPAMVFTVPFLIRIMGIFLLTKYVLYVIDYPFLCRLSKKRQGSPLPKTSPVLCAIYPPACRWTRDVGGFRQPGRQTEVACRPEATRSGCRPVPTRWTRDVGSLRQPSRQTEVAYRPETTRSGCRPVPTRWNRDVAGFRQPGRQTEVTYRPAATRFGCRPTSVPLDP